MPRPIATSQAATTITTIAKICPSPFGPHPREAEQREVAGVEHQLQAEQHDERVAAHEHADGAEREHQRGDDEVPGDVHRTPSPRRAARGSPSVGAGSRRVMP